MKRARGFTVVEMVVTVSVIGVAASMAGAGIASSMQTARRTSDRERLVLEIRAERNMARDQQLPVSITIEPHVADGAPLAGRLSSTSSLSSASGGSTADTSGATGADIVVQPLTACGSTEAIGVTRRVSFDSIAPTLTGSVCFQPDGTLSSDSAVITADSPSKGDFAITIAKSGIISSNFQSHTSNDAIGTTNTATSQVDIAVAAPTPVSTTLDTSVPVLNQVVTNVTTPTNSLTTGNTPPPSSSNKPIPRRTRHDTGEHDTAGRDGQREHHGHGND
jgi:prepilin-type N-terminal cleavage/methylation domain-containing protein